MPHVVVSRDSVMRQKLQSARAVRSSPVESSAEFLWPVGRQNFKGLGNLAGSNPLDPLNGGGRDDQRRG